MVITLNNVCYYLLDRGLITPESVVNGDFVAIDVTRRNRNFKIIRRQFPSFFVKQIQNWEPQAIATLQCEATCYWLAQSEAELAGLALLTPRYHLYDPTRHILVTELLPEAENLSDYHRRVSSFPVEIAVKIGRALGTYHKESVTTLKEGPHNALFPKRIPWILSINQKNAQLFQALSAANSQLFNIVQTYPEFDQALDKLRAGWRFDSLIHGDMKWDNCVVFKTNVDGDDLGFKIVDWELADIGDSRWDVGAILQAYLAFWIMSIPVNSEMSPAQFIEMAQYPLEDMQPAIGAFWKTYLKTLQIEDKDANELLETCVKYGASRMIQTAYEYMQYSPQITSSALYLLQVSLNILRNPKEAINHLLAL
jgi:Phosphotransferase enzyme family